MISVICPLYNEQKYIGSLLKVLVSMEPFDKEIIFIDGMSTDQTAEIIQSYSNNSNNIKLLYNEKRYVPFALNKAIDVAGGDIIVRIDAHTKYSSDYITKIIETFERHDADIVGGPMRAVGNSDFQRSVAVCTSTKFGVGDSKFHDENFEGYTDSVYLGAWKSSVFQKIGNFDTQMYRNQDDEFHYRAKSKGLKIYLNPRIKSYYYPRRDLKSLFLQYFQYGLFKPLVLKKIRTEIKLRHLIPSAFVLYILLVLLYSLVIEFKLVLLIPLFLYFLINVYFSFSIQNRFSEKMVSLLIYPTLHIAYGTGFILGLSNNLRKLFLNVRV